MRFIAKVQVEKTYYMQSAKTEKAIHIVEGSSNSEAEQKVRDFYSKKSIEYQVSYQVTKIKLFEEII